MKIKGYKIPKNFYYNKEHQWVLISKKGEAKIGITDYAQKMLKEITFIYMPEIGSPFNIGDVFCIIESIKARIDIYVPISGEISEVNKELIEKPFTINEDPYGKGWMIEIKPSRWKEESKTLLEQKQYAEYIESLIQIDKDLLIHKWRKPHDSS